MRERGREREGSVEAEELALARGEEGAGEGADVLDDSHGAWEHKEGEIPVQHLGLHKGREEGRERRREGKRGGHIPLRPGHGCGRHPIRIETCSEQRISYSPPLVSYSHSPKHAWGQVLDQIRQRTAENHPIPSGVVPECLFPGTHKGPTRGPQGIRREHRAVSPLPRALKAFGGSMGFRV